MSAASLDAASACCVASSARVSWTAAAASNFDRHWIPAPGFSGSIPESSASMNFCLSRNPATEMSSSNRP